MKKFNTKIKIEYTRNYDDIDDDIEVFVNNIEQLNDSIKSHFEMGWRIENLKIYLKQ